MTSEIAVMNQRAVALAADSAVTLIDGGTVVVRNDQRKLYNLVDGAPIGVMFFGVADMMGHPWEHLIEHFQKKGKSGALPHVRDYAAKFGGMLDNLEEFFPRERQKDDYKRLLASVFRYVFHLAQYLRESGGNQRSDVSDTTILEEAIEHVWKTYQIREDGSQRRDLSCFPPGFGAAVARNYAEVINELISYGFSPFNLDKVALQHLRDIAIFCVVKDLFLEDVTGLVFAGFGTEERYPVVVTYFISAIVGGIVKRAEASVDAIDSEVRSKIRVFADSEVTNAFIRGIDFNLERRFYSAAQMMMYGLVDHIVGSFTGVDATKRESVRGQFRDQVLPQYFNAFRNMIGDYQQQTYINPVLRVLEIAARPELAETARELVALNVFKKRIMAQRQTVGGAIDVAVISREAGFQWWTKQSGG
ncbi:MAG: hypothetical protein KGJ53_12140 [Alphaproteobacteria bacterium]|nr:hypothetical protein [Alphaproteobacteria bacterium]MDE2163905.1 hypothetical protein [Alphaproteobacteria bacterium]